MTKKFLVVMTYLGDLFNFYSVGVILQFTAIANSPVCGGEDGYSENQLTRFCNGKWTIFVTGHTREELRPGVKFTHIL